LVGELQLAVEEQSSHSLRSHITLNLRPYVFFDGDLRKRKNLSAIQTYKELNLKSEEYRQF
jgi:hypothetical protein